MTVKPHHILAASGFFAIASAIQGQAAPAKVIDSAKNLFTVSAALGDACVSRKSPDIKNCATAMMNATLGVGNALESYLGKHHPDNSSARVLAVDCSTNFNAITAKYEYEAKIYGSKRIVPDYFRNAFLGSRRCLQTIESVSTEYGLTYMPSVVSFLHRKINDAENGKIVTGWHI